MLFSLPGKYHNMLHFNKAAHTKHTFYSLFSDLLSEDTVASALCVQRCSIPHAIRSNGEVQWAHFRRAYVFNGLLVCVCRLVSYLERCAQNLQVQPPPPVSRTLLENARDARVRRRAVTRTLETMSIAAHSAAATGNRTTQSRKVQRAPRAWCVIGARSNT